MSHIVTKSIIGSMLFGAAVSLVIPVSAASPAPKQPNSASTAPAGKLLIGSFEGKSAHKGQYGTKYLHYGHEFGWGWTVTTDKYAGGNSVANIILVHPGADGSHGAQHVTGEIKPGFQYGPWAGTIWFPGSEPMQPADLSAKKELIFWARGKPGSYNLMLATGSPRSIPLYAPFVVSSKWKKYHVNLTTSFPNADWKHVYYLAFSAANQGKFEFDLDQVNLH